METPAARPHFVSPATVFAILGATIPGVLQGITGASPAVTALTCLLGVAILAVSIAGLHWAERRPGLTALTAMLTVYGVLVTASLLLTEARAFLVSMPYVSVLVIFLPLRVALAVLLALTGVMAAAFGAKFSGPDLAGAVAGFASAEAFVAVFSLIARRERYARADIERLNLQVAELATARERNRLARELHDSLGHCLTVANVQLEAMRATRGDDQRLVRVQTLLREGLAELRSSVSMLREGAPRPISTALEDLVAECNATGLAAQLTTNGPVRAISTDVGFTLFRVAQEAITNVRRHAQATRVELRLDYAGAAVKLEVRDDGVGRAAAPSQTDGNGLSGLRERVSELGGTVAIDAPPTGGFRVVVQVPAP